MNLGYTCRSSWKHAAAETRRCAPSEAVAAQDHPHKVTVSGIYEIPSGGGASCFRMPMRCGRVLGGWQIQGIYTYQTGPPLQWGNAAIYTDGSRHFPIRPQPPPVVQHHGYFVTASNQRPDGTNFRTWPLRFSTLRPTASITGTLAIKKWKVTEKLGLEFRGEFLNAFTIRALTYRPRTRRITCLDRRIRRPTFRAWCKLQLRSVV